MVAETIVRTLGGRQVGGWSAALTSPQGSRTPHPPTDRRAFAGQTCQAEALAPDVLAGILRDAIEVRIDGRAYARVLARERSVRRDLLNRLRE